MNSGICICLYSFAGGGTERIAVQLANSFQERGLGVHVVVKDGAGPCRKALDPRIPLTVLGGRYRSLTFKIARHLNARRPAAILSFGTDLNLMVLAASALSGWRGRVVVSERTSLESARWRWGSWNTRVIRGMMRALYRRADRVVAVSRRLAGDMVAQLGLPEGKVAAIPNPLNLEEIRQGAASAVTHRFFSEGVPVVVAAGRLNVLKDYPTLFRAMGELSKRRDVRLIVLGEGEEREALEALVNELGLSRAVDLPGFVSPPWPWMARADLLALSSRAEGWPNVLAEALALGVPVVATDCPTGPREILEGGRFGRLVPVGDAAAMSAAMEEVLTAPPDRSALRARAEAWSKDRAVDAYLSCLDGEARPR